MEWISVIFYKNLLSEMVMFDFISPWRIHRKHKLVDLKDICLRSERQIFYSSRRTFEASKTFSKKRKTFSYIYNLDPI